MPGRGVTMGWADMVRDELPAIRPGLSGRSAGHGQLVLVPAVLGVKRSHGRTAEQAEVGEDL